MNIHHARSIILAAGLSLAAGAAQAQAGGGASSPSPAANLGYSAAPLSGQGYAYGTGSNLTVMGMTGAVQPKYPETTGSITTLPPGAWSARVR